MGYRIILWVIFVFGLFAFTETANAEDVNNKLFFQKNVIGTGLVFIEANTDPNKGVGDPTALPLRHDYFSLLRKSGWKIAPPGYRDVAISCLIEESDSDLILVHCYNNNPGGKILMLVTILKDGEIESYISETIQLMINKMIEDKPYPQEPSRVPAFCKISLQFL